MTSICQNFKLHQKKKKKKKKKSFRYCKNTILIQKNQLNLLRKYDVFCIIIKYELCLKHLTTEKELGTFGRFPLISYKGDNIYHFIFAFLQHLVLSEKGPL